MKILFISRAFPPITGGIENQNAALAKWLPKHATVRTLANPYGKKFLPFFFIYVTLRSLVTLHHYDVVLFGDGVLSVVGSILKKFFPQKKIVSVVHGLDLTYQSPFYQKYWVQKFLPALDSLIAVSAETKNQALQKGIPEDKVSVIANGIESEILIQKHTRAELAQVIHQALSTQIVLFTGGRLIKRKGVAWFIRSVLASLPSDALYVVAGGGPDEENIRHAIKETGLENRVILLGRVSPEQYTILLNTIDIFIQPNIPVPGDMEGFGIAVIEAAACGRLVVASRLEGLKDAIIEGENGLLVEPENTDAWIAAITKLLQDTAAREALGKKAALYTKEHYHWATISKQYIATLERLMK